MDERKPFALIFGFAPSTSKTAKRTVRISV
jgi:hypothetical protein